MAEFQKKRKSRQHKYGYAVYEASKSRNADIGVCVWESTRKVLCEKYVQKIAPDQDAAPFNYYIERFKFPGAT